jgi:hypothetical protein
MRDRRFISSGGREVGNAGHRVSAVLDDRDAAQGDKQLALKFNERNVNLFDYNDKENMLRTGCNSTCPRSTE